MKKNYKKLLSAFAAFSIAASSAVIPTAVSADSSINVDGSTASVSSDKDGKILVASYESDGRLKSIKSQDIAAGATETVTVNENDKVLLWDGTDSIEPLTDAATVNAAEPTPTADVSEPTPTADVSEPTSTPGTDEPKPIGETIKFDFGSGDNVADGYYSVTKDTVYTTNTSGDLQYGLHGTDGNGDKVSQRTDGIRMQEGQNIELMSGSNEQVVSADDDWLGLVDGQYPLRFAMKTANNTYYKVKAVLTGADQTQAANVSLYSEKRHPIVENSVINPGETKTVEFVATVQNVYYQKSDPTGTYNDDQLNVVLLGDNAAISSLEITPIEHVPTVWVYTDSTGCDYQANLPYFGLQNFGGVGQWLTKYLPENIALSNQGEGGLNAYDNMHWNCANANIQAGDYVYVEYGHNHKEDGPEGYLSAIPKYYELAHERGAYTIFVGPCDRHNETNGKKETDPEFRRYYFPETNTWTSTLSGFSDAARSYVEGLIADGADDVAFVDINEPSLRWMEGVCEDVKTKRGADVYEANATDYYFQGEKGGSIDGTHPNDAGADNLAYCFFTEAKETVDAGSAADATDSQKIQANVLSGLVTGMRDASPYVVSQEIVDAGKAPNNAYPDVYTPPNLPQYPVVISDILFDEDGSVTSAAVKVQDAEIDMDAYGIVVITIYDTEGAEVGKLYAVDQVDNSTGFGTQTITNFRGEATLEEGYTYSAQVFKAVDGDSGLEVDPENIAYSAEYVPTNVSEYLITNEDGDPGESFTYYGAEDGTDIDGHNGWGVEGSAGRDTTLGTDEDTHYVRVMSDGIKDGSANNGSFYLYKSLDKTIGTTGKYQIKMDINYVSGSVYGTNYFTVKLADGSNKTNGGSQSLALFTIRNEGKLYINDTEVGALNANTWSTIDYTLDMDNATASISVSGGDPVTVVMPNYAVNTNTVSPTQSGFINFDINRSTIDLKLANLYVNELKQDTLADKTLSVASSSETMGAVSIAEESGLSVTAPRNTIKTISAEAQDGYEFVQWVDEDGNTFSYSDTVTVRIHDDLSLTAQFQVAVVDPITYAFNENFTKLTTETLEANGWDSPNAQANMTIESDSTGGIGNYLKYGANSSSRGASKALPEKAAASASSDNKLVYSMDIKFNKANTDPHEFAVHGGNIEYNSGNINYGCTGGYILHIEESPAGAVTINDTATDIPDNTWIHIYTIMDFTNHTVDVTATSLDEETTYYSGTVNMADTSADGISGFYYKFGRQSGGIISFDNIKIYTADQISENPNPSEPANAEQAVLNSLTDDETEVSGTYVVNLEDLQ